MKHTAESKGLRRLHWNRHVRSGLTVRIFKMLSDLPGVPTQLYNAKTTPSKVYKPQPAVDITTRAIGDFGRWQMWISLQMTLLKLPIAWYQLNIIFMAPPQDFWCAKPPNLKYSEEEWRQICAPRIEEHPCLIYDPDMIATTPEMDRAMLPLVLCKRFIYDQTVFNSTMTSEWDLLTQCTMMWGVLLGGIIFGILADKYGRKTPLMVGIVMQSACSFIASYLLWYWWFLLNWFLLALASGGVAIISFVLCMEIVSGKYRTTIPIIYQMPFGLGNTVMAGLAYWLRDWRKLEFGLATISALFICYWLTVPESPRWLLATGQTDKALEVLRSAAKFNNMQFNENEIRNLLPRSNAQKRKGPGFIAFFGSKNMRLKTILISINWFCTGLAFYTFSQYLGAIGGNIFLAVAFTGLISVFGGIICVFIVTKVGRKTTVRAFQLSTALCFVLLLVIPKDTVANDWPRLLCAGIGFAGMAGSIPALYLLTGELFPTVGRNVGVSGVTMFARIASMIAPAVVSWDVIFADLPLILLAIMSFAQIFLLMPIPETKDCPLPDTLEQAELF